MTAVTEVVRIAAGPATCDIYIFTRGRPRWRAALSEELASRLESAA